MTDAAPGTAPKTRKRKPKPLLPPDEADKYPPPVLTRREKIFRFIRDHSPKIGVKSPFATPPITVDIVDEFTEIKRFDRVLKKLNWGAMLIAFFGVSLAMGAPFFSPLYVFHSITPEGKTAILVPLDLPNLTNLIATVLIFLIVIYFQGQFRPVYHVYISSLSVCVCVCVYNSN